MLFRSSPDFEQLRDSDVAEAHQLDIAVIPWTINTPAEMAHAVQMGVDGLITDYPDRARATLGELGVPLPRVPPHCRHPS